MDTWANDVKTSSMIEKEDQIAEAAIRVISRYGVKRTTMHDIATEAAISRQTLYNFYSNKDEVLRGTIRCFNRKALAAVRLDWAQPGTLSERLGSLFRHIVVKPFEMIHTMPEADDLISGFNEAGKEEIANAQEQYRLLIEQALTPYGSAIERSGLNAVQLSDFICRTAIGFKYQAKDRQHLLELLSTLIVLVLRTTDTA